MLRDALRDPQEGGVGEPRVGMEVQIKLRGALRHALLGAQTYSELGIARGSAAQ